MKYPHSVEKRNPVGISQLDDCVGFVSLHPPYGSKCHCEESFSERTTKQSVQLRAKGNSQSGSIPLGWASRIKFHVLWHLLPGSAKMSQDDLLVK